MLSPRADQDSVQMLQRSSQIGEFYRMSPPEVFPGEDKLPSTYMGAPLHSNTVDGHLLYTAQHDAPRRRPRPNCVVLLYSDRRPCT